MNAIPVIAGGAAVDTKPSVISGGAEVPVYDGYGIEGGQAVKIYQSAVPFTVDGAGGGRVTVTFAEPILVNPTDDIYAYGHGETESSSSWDMRMDLNAGFSDGTGYFKSGSTDSDAFASSTLHFSEAFSSPKYLTQVMASLHFIDADGTQIVDYFGLDINGVSYDLMQDGEIDI